MITLLVEGHYQAYEISNPNTALLKDALWIDLVNPTAEIAEHLKDLLGLPIPNRDNMLEIEVSRRLHQNDETLFMTLSLITRATTLLPSQEPVSFILTPKQLITVRYFESQSFKRFYAQSEKDLASYSPGKLLVGLLESINNRLADILEVIASHLDHISQKIFRDKNLSKVSKQSNYYHIMKKIGSNADLNTKVRESLITFKRLIDFLKTHTTPYFSSKEKSKLDILCKDVSALNDYGNFISTKINFLLDATLGMINIEQNVIIKIFSIAAVIFLPPTLIGTIYGMNFSYMPELSHKWGYFITLGVMVLSGVVSYLFFKYKRWL